MTALALVLPLAVVLLLARTGSRLAARDGLPAPRRHGLLFAAVATASLGVVLSEALGAMNGLTPGGIALGWAVVLAGVWLVPWERGQPDRRVTDRARGGEPWRRHAVTLGQRAIRPRSPGDVAVRSMLAIVVLVLGVTLIIALAAPPNTWDSMTYHMSRVAHWAQQGSLAHYPTHIARQVLYTPGAELGLLNLQVLWGGDRLANLLQWGSFAGLLIAASVLAAHCGANPVGQALAAVIAATMPMAILQATSTQNDLVNAFALATLVCWIAAWRVRPAPWLAAAMGASLGLALLVKITAYVIALPFVVWLGADLVRRGRRGIQVGVTVGGLALALSLGHYARHGGLWWRAGLAPTASAPPATAPLAAAPRPAAGGGAFGRVGTLRYLNSAMSPALLASNVVRNLALHAALPSEGLRRLGDRAMAAAHTRIGLDPADPRNTYPAGHGFRAPGFERHEDVAPNPLHLAVLLAAAVWVIGGRGTPPLARTLLALVGVAFLLFALVFKWQPWHSRLHLPLFMIAAPAVASIIAHDARLRPLALPLAIVLAAASLPWLVANVSRPLLGDASVLRAPRQDQYFINRPDLQAPYLAAARLLRERGCREVGLMIGGNEWEYPLWIVLGDGRPPRMQHVAVTNVSRFAAASPAPDPPCAIIAVGVPEAGEMAHGGRRYTRALHDGRVQVLLP